MSSNKKVSLLRTIFTANGSCGCGKTKDSEVHEPIRKPKYSSNQPKTNASSMASSIIDDDDFASTTISEPETTIQKSPLDSLLLKRSPLVESVAVEKDSSNPYHDFRHSMLQMIFEKEIDSEEDLHDLLRLFLHLNAPCHHHVIVKAFNAICEEAFPDKVSNPSRTKKKNNVGKC